MCVIGSTCAIFSCSRLHEVAQFKSILKLNQTLNTFMVCSGVTVHRVDS